MKKLAVMMIIAVAMSAAACGATEKETQTAEVSTQAQLEKVDSTEEKEEIVLNHTRTALSDSGVQPPNLDILPEGVAPEFMHFMYEDSKVGPYKAQQYLEEIGVSVEGEKIVVLWEQGSAASPVTIDVYECNTEPVLMTTYYFTGNKLRFERTIEDMGEENVAFSDPEANYFCTLTWEMDDYYSYDFIVEHIETESCHIVW